MKLTSDKRIRVSSLTGHVIVMEPGAVMDIPEAVAPELLAAGARVPKETNIITEDPSLTAHQQLVGMVGEIVAGDTNTDFKKNKTSIDLKLLSARVGFKVTAAQREAALSAVLKVKPKAKK